MPRQRASKRPVLWSLAVVGSAIAIAVLILSAVDPLPAAQIPLSAAIISLLVLASAFFVILRRATSDHRTARYVLFLEKLRLSQAVNNMTQGLLLFDSEERIAMANDRYIAMYGLSPDVVKPGCSFRDLIRHRQAGGTFQGDVEEYRASLLRALSQGKATELLIRTPDGRSIRIVNTPLASGGWVATHEDVTETHRLQEERDRNWRFLDKIIESVPAAILVRDAVTRQYMLVNRAAEEHLGADRDAVIGKTAQEIWPDNAHVIDEHDARLLQSKDSLFLDEHEVESPGKGSRFVTAKRLAITDSDGAPQYLLAVIEDVTERRRANEQIAHLAHHDGLTGLPNRALFLQELEKALNRIDDDQKLALLYLDFDQFKHVNDTFGHSIGDALLKAVAKSLQDCLDDRDFIARLGGDEFAIIRTAIHDAADVTPLLHQIHDALKKPCIVSGHSLVADASIGIALAPTDSKHMDVLLKYADLAMYSAKADGRGHCRFFDATMEDRLAARSRMEFELRQAIKYDNLKLFYQPIFRISDKHITGFEALLRWPGANGDIIAPADFVPLAEETGLIEPIGKWVLRTACCEAVQWPGEIKVAVNVSPVQFRSGNLVEIVRDALACSGLAPTRLEIEITEAVLINDDESALAILHQLRALGVHTAMDDFGTGYSSLSYLQRFPFDKIKIDRTFVKDAPFRDGSRSIVQAIVGIAQTSSITTTAEGVETEDQLLAMRLLGVDEMQGFLMSRPLPNLEVVKLLSARQASAA